MRLHFAELQAPGVQLRIGFADFLVDDALRLVAVDGFANARDFAARAREQADERAHAALRVSGRRNGR